MPVSDAANALEALLVKPLRDAATPDRLRAAAKETGPAVNQLVKALGARLAGCGPLLAPALGNAACLALEALDLLRPVLKSSAQELDVQRYGFVRKLTALGLYEASLQQGLVLYNHTAASAQGKPCQAPSDLQVAAVLNLLVCYTAMAAAKPSAAPASEAKAKAPCPMAKAWSAVRGPSFALMEGLRCACRHAALMHMG